MMQCGRGISRPKGARCLMSLQKKFSSSPQRNAVRTKIVHQIEEVHLRANQTLKQFELPGSVYELAKEFVSVAVIGDPTVTSGSSSCPFVVLCCIEGDVYSLLNKAAEGVVLEQARGVIDKWEEAIRALLRYAVNLLLAPKRPELKTVNLYSAFFIYNVANKLKGAEEILIALGYSRSHQPNSSPSCELVYKGEVNVSHVAETAADLVVLLSQLEHLRVRVEEALKLYQQAAFSDILKTWGSSFHSVVFTDTASVSTDSGKVGVERSARGQSPPSKCIVDSSKGEYRGLVQKAMDMQPLIGVERSARGQSPPSKCIVDSSEGEYRGLVQKAMEMQPLKESGHCYPPEFDRKVRDVPDKALDSPDELSRVYQKKGSDSLTSYEGRVNRVRQDSFMASSPSTSDRSSFTDSFIQSVPRPDVNDLPAPIYITEAEFSLGKKHYSHDNRAEFIIDSRSDQDAYGNLPGEFAFSPSEASVAPSWNRDTSEMELSCSEVQESSRMEIPNSQHALSRSFSHNSDQLEPLEYNNSLHGNKGTVYKSDGDITASQHQLSGQEDKDYGVEVSSDNGKSIIIRELSLSVHDPVVVIDIVEDSSQTGNHAKTAGSSGQSSSPSPSFPSEKSLGDRTKAAVLCEGKETKEGFVVVNYCTHGDSKESQGQTIDHKDDKTEAAHKERSQNSGGVLIRKDHKAADTRRGENGSMWTCEYCTYINTKEVDTCEICGVKRN